MDHADTRLEGRIDQIQHPIRGQDEGTLTNPFTQNSGHPQGGSQLDDLNQEHINFPFSTRNMPS